MTDHNYSNTWLRSGKKAIAQAATPELVEAIVNAKTGQKYSRYSWDFTCRSMRARGYYNTAALLEAAKERVDEINNRKN